MCNAWNHPPNCTCGWGGVGHAGRRSTGSDSRASYSSPYWWVPPIHRSYESFVNPNASCPDCHEQVFFYQSPDGGRVFFDELGPPWPKHPCTDHSSIPKQITATSTNEHFSNKKIYQWQKDEWNPFFINVVSSVDNEFLKLSGEIGEDRLVLYLRKSLEKITTDSIAQIKKISGTKYEISYLDEMSKTVRKTVFSVLWEAREHQGKIIPPKKSKKSPNHKIRAKKNKNENTPVQNSTNKSNNPVELKSTPRNKTKSHKKRKVYKGLKPTKHEASNKETAMSLAYAKAKEKLIDPQ